jgi:hypothetical protein
LDEKGGAKSSALFVLLKPYSIVFVQGKTYKVLKPIRANATIYPNKPYWFGLQDP